MAKVKKQLTREEEFDILKLVLDKFLWMGILIMGFGFFRMVTSPAVFWESFLIMIVGVILMLLFSWLLIKEYKFMK